MARTRVATVFLVHSLLYTVQAENTAHYCPLPAHCPPPAHCPLPWPLWTLSTASYTPIVLDYAACLFLFLILFLFEFLHAITGNNLIAITNHGRVAALQPTSASACLHTQVPSTSTQYLTSHQASLIPDTPVASCLPRLWQTTSPGPGQVCFFILFLFYPDFPSTSSFFFSFSF